MLVHNFRGRKPPTDAVNKSRKIMIHAGQTNKRTLMGQGRLVKAPQQTIANNPNLDDPENLRCARIPALGFLIFLNLRTLRVNGRCSWVLDKFQKSDSSALQQQQLTPATRALCETNLPQIPIPSLRLSLLRSNPDTLRHSAQRTSAEPTMRGQALDMIRLGPRYANLSKAWWLRHSTGSAV